MKGIRKSLKPGGHLILFEPILEPNSTMMEVDHSWKEQGMKIRDQGIYHEELISNGFELV